MAHAHHHHGDDDEPVTSQRTQQILIGIVAALGLAAVVGLFLLWPEDERPVLADELGMGAELVDATVRTVEEVPCRGTVEAEGILCNEVRFDVDSGSSAGESGQFQVPISEAAVTFDEGDEIVVGYQSDIEPEFAYYFNDFQRDLPLTILAVLFVLAVLALGRWQGLRALIGLGITGVVIVAFLFPSVLDGNSPIAVALVAAVVIALVALYVTHGVTERTTVALLGTFSALGVTAVLAWLFSAAANFTGFGTEDAFYLQVASSAVDIKGLILAGIIIGSLGVLDDVTVTQVSAVWQLHQANPTMGRVQLYRAAVSIGRDHIASTVNTLVLAYAGASLPLLLIYTQAGRALTDVVAGELVAVEVVRTLVGSIGLITAVPVTTALAAAVVVGGSALRKDEHADEHADEHTDEHADEHAEAPAPATIGAPLPPTTATTSAAEPPAAPTPDPADDGPTWDQFAPDDPRGW